MAAWKSGLDMDNVAAVALRLVDGGTRYFLVYEIDLDAETVEAAAMEAAQRNDFGGQPVEAKVCTNLQEASGEPYFFECLFEMTRDAVPPSSWRYGRWKRRVARDIKEGQGLWFLGRPTQPR